MADPTMADDTNRSVPNPRQGGQGRGPRQGDGRGEPGGYRIRLSDNEMQAARALQEALGLRSTVSVLGFCLRTMAQQLEAGQLDEIVAQQRAQAWSRGPAGAGRGGERRGGRDEGRGTSGPGRGERPNPFARPSRPAPAAAPAEPEAAPEAEGEAPVLEPAEISDSIDTAPDDGDAAAEAASEA